MRRRELRLTNLDKPMYPTGFTKRDMIDYYVRIAPVMLPHIEGRPMTLKRFPDGAMGPHFFEKNCPGHRPEWLETIRSPARNKAGQVEYCRVSSVEGLAWTANLASIELHAPLGRAPDLARPEAVVFDLDPGPGQDLAGCARVALRLKSILDPLGLEACAKSSGLKGLHVLVPVAGADYAGTKSFARSVALALERDDPAGVTSVMAKALRPGRVFVDWSQNDASKTTVCVYSLRAAARPVVSAPLHWDEVREAAESGRADRLVLEAGEVLSRAEAGDIFAPLLRQAAALPGVT